MLVRNLNPKPEIALLARDSMRSRKRPPPGNPFPLLRRVSCSGFGFDKVGYRVVPRVPGTTPDYVAVFNYGIDDGREVITSSEDPVYGDKDNPRRSQGTRPRPAATLSIDA
jgi:hypothetical protein